MPHLWCESQHLSESTSAKGRATNLQSTLTHPAHAIRLCLPPPNRWQQRGLISHILSLGCLPSLPPTWCFWNFSCLFVSLFCCLHAGFLASFPAYFIAQTHTYTNTFVFVCLVLCLYLIFCIFCFSFTDTGKHTLMYTNTCFLQLSLLQHSFVTQLMHTDSFMACS